jgi:hypothetical protein
MGTVGTEEPVDGDGKRYHCQQNINNRPHSRVSQDAYASSDYRHNKEKIPVKAVTQSMTHFQLFLSNLHHLSFPTSAIKEYSSQR